VALRPARDELFDWILSLGPTVRYNLTSSGLSEPDLQSMGIDTSFERFAAEKYEHERVFAEEVARLYKVEPGNVVATNGASEAIFLVYSVLGVGGRAVIPLPNYPSMFTVPRSLGIEVGNSLRPTGARGTIFGLTDPNNPTGVSLDEDAVDRLTDSARGTGTNIFINETYREFTFPGTPMTHFGTSSKVVTSNTMTKFYGLGRLRVGWILADAPKARQLLYAKWAVSGHDSEYSLWIAAQVLRNRARFVERARQIHTKNLELVRRFLGRTKGVSADLGAAPFCLVHYRKGPASVSLARNLMQRAGVLVSPGDFFGAPRAFRLCFTADEKTLRDGLDALSNFFNGI
jgi:aspartate/methionine/tyrosine aminotransferase